MVANLTDIATVKLPPRINKRGRPKGSELTVIGLPKKRLKEKSKPVIVSKLEENQQQKNHSQLVCQEGGDRKVFQRAIHN